MEKKQGIIGGRIAQWQSIGLQFLRSLVRIRLCPLFFFKKERRYENRKQQTEKGEKKRIRRLRSSAVKYLLRVQVARVRFPAEPLILQERRERIEEGIINRRRVKGNNKKALQLSGKIPAQGAGGAGSIPAKAPFFRVTKEKSKEEKRKRSEE